MERSARTSSLLSSLQVSTYQQSSLQSAGLHVPAQSADLHVPAVFWSPRTGSVRLVTQQVREQTVGAVLYDNKGAEFSCPCVRADGRSLFIFLLYMLGKFTALQPLEEDLL